MIIYKKGEKNMSSKKSTNQKKNGLQVKDCIVMGVFGALLMLACSIGGAFFAVNPALTFYFPLGSAVLAGPVYMLLVAKVPKRGALSIVGLIIAALVLITGMHWAMALGSAICSILADFVAGAGEYKSKKINILSYMVFSLGCTGTYLAFYINSESWARFMIGNGTSQDYIDTMKNAATTQMLIIMYVGTLVIAFLSAFAGSKLLRKQFEKAGITK